jgi:hypothetical protein
MIRLTKLNGFLIKKIVVTFIICVFILKFLIGIHIFIHRIHPFLQNLYILDYLLSNLKILLIFELFYQSLLFRNVLTKTL